MQITIAHQEEATQTAADDIGCARAWVTYRHRAEAKKDELRVAKAQEKIKFYVKRAQQRRAFAAMVLSA